MISRLREVLLDVFIHVYNRVGKDHLIIKALVLLSKALAWIHTMVCRHDGDITWLGVMESGDGFYMCDQCGKIQRHIEFKRGRES